MPNHMYSAAFRIWTAMVATGLAGAAYGQSLEITRSAGRQSREAPAANFTGTARVDMLFGSLFTADISGGSVAFAPGARTAWHSHPGGQTLIVTAGVGRVQRWGDVVEEIRAGDVVRIPADQKHWHGAAPEAAMTHIAITEPRGGKAVDWMEQVSDEQYNAVPRRAQASTPAAPQQQAAQPPPAGESGNSRPSGPLQQRLAPGLASLTDDVLYGDVWRRAELAPRERSLVTISSLIATGKTAQLTGHLSRGLDNGLRPTETSGLLAHLAIYSGWPNAVSALAVYEQVYAARKIDVAVLRVVTPRLPAAAGAVPGASGPVAERAPKFAQLTKDVVFDDLWRRADLAPPDRSLVTIAALAATGETDQLEFYVRRGLEVGLTHEQITEAITHLGFYAGWGRATSAMQVVARISAGAAQ